MRDPAYIEYQHPGETSYLTDILHAVRVEFHQLEKYAAPAPVITAGMLADWITVHRPSLAVCQGQHSGRLFDPVCVHQADVLTIDAFVRLLQAGVSDGALIRYVTSDDMDAMSAARVRIAACAHTLERKW